MRSQENYIISVSIKRARLRHWNEEQKTKKPEQIASSHLLLDVKFKKNKKTKD
jgi:hypothetical protein